MAIPTSFPNILSPDTDKNSKEFGLKFLQSVYDRWKRGEGESAVDRKRRYNYIARMLLVSRI